MADAVSWPPAGSAIAHRGAGGTAPENTVASCVEALRHGADIIEIDLQRTADGELVVTHDARMGRTSNIAETLPDRADRLVSELTLPELRKLDAGSWFGAAWHEATVPTLTEVLTAVDRQATLFVEIKWPERHPHIVSELIETLHRFFGSRLGGPDVPVAVQLADAGLLPQLREGLPGVPLCVMTGLVDPLPTERLADLADLISGYVVLGRALEPGYAARVRDLGMQVLPWTIDAPEAVAAMRAEGIESVITNFQPQVAPLLSGEPSPLPRAPLRVASADPDTERYSVRNTADTPVELAGWFTRNHLMSAQPLPAGSLAPGEELTVEPERERYLDNYGETLALHAPDGAVVDLFGYRLA